LNASLGNTLHTTRSVNWVRDSHHDRKHRLRSVPRVLTVLPSSITTGTRISAEGTLSTDGKTMTATRITVLPAGNNGRGSHFPGSKAPKAGATATLERRPRRHLVSSLRESRRIKHSACAKLSKRRNRLQIGEPRKRMAMELTESLRGLLTATAKAVAGAVPGGCSWHARCGNWGPGGQSLAERELGWNRETIPQGPARAGQWITCVDAFRLRGRKPAELCQPHYAVRDMEWCVA